MRPATLKPWQGGPPMTRSGRSSAGGNTFSTSPQTLWSPMLAAYVWHAHGSKSLAQSTWKPARVKPRSRPPAPEYRLMAV